jgi:hypothetical protein
VDRLRFVDLPIAMRIVRDGFGDEAGVVLATYLWYFWRRARLPDFGWMARSTDLRFMTAGDPLSIRVSSATTHGRSVAWLDICDNNSFSHDALGSVLTNWPYRHKLLVLRTNEVLIEELRNDCGLQLAGEFPPGLGTARFLYTYRPHDDTQRMFRVTSNRQSLDIFASFHLVRRDHDPIGVTGVYATNFWPEIAWGAWAAISRRAAYRQTALKTLALTEDLAREMQKRWFCVETSDAERYRAARRIYELYGLQAVLKIENFYDSDSDGRREAYIVYGKKLLH